MELEVYRSMWGVALDDPEGMLDETQAWGYDGVCVSPLVLPDVGRFREAIEERGIKWLPQVFTFGRTLEEHLGWFQRSLEEVVAFGPRLVIAQAGRDGWDEDTSAAFLEAALALEAEHGVPVAHETHRARILYNPWVTDRMLDRFPELHLNCDLSHWVVVAERLLDHEGDILARCVARARHFDARVGWEEGPQVPDPRQGRFERHLEKHIEWWSAIWSAQREAGHDVAGFTPEFGPPPYQPSDPLTGAPFGDIHELNRWMAGYLRERLPT